MFVSAGSCARSSRSKALLILHLSRYPLELHVVHVKVGEADPLNTPKGLSVTGFFFEVDGVSLVICSGYPACTVDCQDNTNTALAPLTNALQQIVVSNSQVDFQTIGFSVSVSQSYYTTSSHC